MKMRKPIPTSSAMRGIGANLARDQRDEEKADLIEVVRASALQIAALTELVMEMEGRMAQLEAKG
jgi:hypothetical protein